MVSILTSNKQACLLVLCEQNLGRINLINIIIAIKIDTERHLQARKGVLGLVELVDIVGIVKLVDIVSIVKRGSSVEMGGSIKQGRIGIVERGGYVWMYVAIKQGRVVEGGCVVRLGSAIDRCGFLREGSGAERGGAVSISGIIDGGDAVNRGGAVKIQDVWCHRDGRPRKYWRRH